MKRLLPFLALITLLGCQKNDPGLTENLDLLFETELGPSSPGGGVVVVQNGKTIFNKGYGLANIEQRVPYEKRTVADLGSVAKHFTAYAIAQLEYEGELDFDDEIQEHLDWIPRDISKKDITIDHLLHHTSGLREIYGALAINGFRSGDGITQEDGRTLVKYSKELNFEPGERYSYCNSAYMLLADIVEAVSGKSFETYMQDHVFGPHDMEHTYIMDRQGEVFSMAANSYRTQDDGTFTTVYDNSSAYGQGGIYSSLIDMSEWMKDLLDARGSHKTIFKTMQNTGQLNSGEDLDYAFGLVVDQYRGMKRIQHSGASAGFRSQMSLYPEHNLGIFIQSNFGELNRTAIHDQVLEVLIDSLPANIVEENRTHPEPDYLILESSELADYEGQYYAPEIQATYDILIDGDKLVAAHRRNGNIDLNATAIDVFESDSWYFSDLVFTRNVFGNVDGMELSNGRVQNLKFNKR